MYDLLTYKRCRRSGILLRLQLRSGCFPFCSLLRSSCRTFRSALFQQRLHLLTACFLCNKRSQTLYFSCRRCSQPFCRRRSGSSQPFRFGSSCRCGDPCLLCCCSSGRCRLVEVAGFLHPPQTISSSRKYNIRIRIQGGFFRSYSRRLISQPGRFRCRRRRYSLGLRLRGRCASRRLTGQLGCFLSRATIGLVLGGLPSVPDRLRRALSIGPETRAARPDLTQRRDEAIKLGALLGNGAGLHSHPTTDMIQHCVASTIALVELKNPYHQSGIRGNGYPAAIAKHQHRIRSGTGGDTIALVQRRTRCEHARRI